MRKERSRFLHRLQQQPSQSKGGGYLIEYGGQVPVLQTPQTAHQRSRLVHTRTIATDRSVSTAFPPSPHPKHATANRECGGYLQATMTGCWETSRTISRASLISSSLIGFQVTAGRHDLSPRCTYAPITRSTSCVSGLRGVAMRPVRRAYKLGAIVLQKLLERGTRCVRTEVHERLQLQALDEGEIERLRDDAAAVHVRFDDAERLRRNQRRR